MEHDAPRPLNVYGRSKQEGERAVLDVHPEAMILRASWVFSHFGSNFVKTMLKAGAERSRLKIASDHFGNPTPEDGLAAAILAIAAALRGEPAGLYDLTGEGSTSWHDFTTCIFQESLKRGGPAPLLEAIPSAAYETAAVRPMNSRLDCAAIASRFGVNLSPWTETTEELVLPCLSR